jgi:hypothetical protein
MDDDFVGYQYIGGIKDEKKHGEGQMIFSNGDK